MENIKVLPDFMFETEIETEGALLAATQGVLWSAD
jgi:hypothetical protein